MSTLYLNKYLKYKQKYIELKINSEQIAAGSPKNNYSIYYKCLDYNAQKAFNKLVDRDGKFSYDNIDEDLKKDYNFIMTIMTDVTTSIFEKIRPEFQNIEKIAKVAIDKHIELFKYVSDRLKDDNDFVKYAFEKDISIYKLISDRLKNNKDFIKELVISNQFIYPYLEVLKDDKDIALIAIKKNPKLLEIAPDVIKDDDDIVDYACIFDKSVFKFASPRLQKVQGCKRNLLPADQCTT
jgi:hypothetical protein